MARNMFSYILIGSLLASVVIGSTVSTEKTTHKRGVPGYSLAAPVLPLQHLQPGPVYPPVVEDPSWIQPQQPWSPASLPQPASNPWAPQPASNPWASFLASKHIRMPFGYASPAEVATAVAAAKEASTNVLIAQQQVQAAKEAVLAQQRIAAAKEAHAAIAVQKSEAAAALQRSEASAAAQAVVLAQQRVADAKASVSHQQRIAAAKEAQAAAAIQSSATAAAAEIRATEHEAAKLSAMQRSDAAAAVQHVTATKDATLGSFTPVPGVHTVLAPWASPSAASTAPWNALYVPARTYHPWG